MSPMSYARAWQVCRKDREYMEKKKGLFPLSRAYDKGDILKVWRSP